MNKTLLYLILLTAFSFTLSAQSHYLWLTYDVKLNGYDVKVKYMPYFDKDDSTYYERGEALIMLDNGVKQYQIESTMSVWDLQGTPLQKPGSEIKMPYYPKKEGDILAEYGRKSPMFFFSDVDFDGVDEFITSEYGSCSRYSDNGYRVFELRGDKYVERNDGPFEELEGYYIFDRQKHTITIRLIDGCYGEDTIIWKGNGDRFEIIKQTEHINL